MSGLDNSLHLRMGISSVSHNQKKATFLNMYVTDGRVSTSVEPSQRPNPSSEDLHTNCLQKKKRSTYKAFNFLFQTKIKYINHRVQELVKSSKLSQNRSLPNSSQLSTKVKFSYHPIHFKLDERISFFVLASSVSAVFCKPKTFLTS